MGIIKSLQISGWIDSPRCCNWLISAHLPTIALGCVSLRELVTEFCSLHILFPADYAATCSGWWACGIQHIWQDLLTLHFLSTTAEICVDNHKEGQICAQEMVLWRCRILHFCIVQHSDWVSRSWLLFSAWQHSWTSCIRERFHCCSTERFHCCSTHTYEVWTKLHTSKHQQYSRDSSLFACTRLFLRVELPWKVLLLTGCTHVLQGGRLPYTMLQCNTLQKAAKQETYHCVTLFRALWDSVLHTFLKSLKTQLQVLLPLAPFDVAFWGHDSVELEALQAWTWQEICIIVHRLAIPSLLSYAACSQPWRPSWLDVECL